MLSVNLGQGKFLTQNNMKKKFISGLMGLAMIAGITPAELSFAQAGSVVINEVAWAGSKDNSNDEWIELYNPGNNEIDLAGWVIKDDETTSYTITAGKIPAKGYFLIEDAENVVSDIQSDIVIPLSLANTGDKLQLFNASGLLIDTVNGSGGAWYAGGGADNATMERVDSAVGDVSTNFVISTGSIGKGSSGTALKATPKALNSVSSGGGGGSGGVNGVSFVNTNVKVGDNFTVGVAVNGVSDVFSYGLAIDYDASMLEFVEAKKGVFLSQNGSSESTFYAGLENGLAGRVILAEARTGEPKSSVSGSGELLSLTFKALKVGSTKVDFDEGNSFLSSLTGDLSVPFADLNLQINTSVDLVVKNIVSAQGSNRYELKIDWADLPDAEKFEVERKNQIGEWKKIAEVNVSEFVDKDGIVNGGDLVPGVQYSYRVRAVKAGVNGDFVEVNAVDDRGLKGDNNRTDLVDGRDLDRLAKAFGVNFGGQGYLNLVDTTYDGRIDGSDLIDIGANFAKKY